MSALLQDLRYCARNLGKSPGFAAVAVLTLALGIGANTTMFSVVRAILIRPLPYPDSEKLVAFTTNQSGPDVEDIAARSRTFSYLAGAQNWPFDWLNGSETEKARAAIVTGQVFTALGTAAELGRTILPSDDVPGAERVVLVGHDFWKSKLAGDPGVVGRALTIGGKPATVVGVMPASFEVPRVPADMWLPFRVFDRGAAQARGVHALRAFARLAPGASLAAAREELSG